MTSAVFERHLAPRPPYHLARTLSGLRMGIDPTLRLEGRGARWAWHTPAGPAALEVEPAGDGLRVRGFGAGAGWLQPRLEAMLGLEDPAGEFRPDHPAVRRLWQGQAGMRLPRLPRVFHRLAQVVLLQRVTSVEGHRAWRRLVAAHGHDAPGPAGLRLPPSAEQLARLPGWELSRLGVPSAQAETLQRLARRAESLEARAREGPEALAAALGAQPGIGPWTVAYVLGSALGCADAVLVGDYNLPREVAWVLAGEERAGDERMLELLEPFRPHRFRVIRLVWAGGHGAPRRGPRRALPGRRR